MARKRMLSPSFWDDDSIGLLSNEARLLFLCCISQADDDGRLTGSAATLKKVCFGFTSVSVEQVEIWLNDIAANVRSFKRYSVDGHPYIALLNWTKYQKVDHPTPSLIPVPLTEDSGTTPVLLGEDSVSSTTQLDELDELDELDQLDQSGKPVPEEVQQDPREKLVKRFTKLNKGKFTEIDRDRLETWIEDHGIEAVNEAVAVALEAERSNPVAYIGGVLRRSKSAAKALTQTGPGWRNVVVEGKTYHVPPNIADELDTWCCDITMRRRRIKDYQPLEVT